MINGRRDERVGGRARGLRDEVPGAQVSGRRRRLRATPSRWSGCSASLGDVDILVNNVGVFEVAPFEDIADDDWQRYFDVNVMSGVRLSRHVLPGMLARGWGRDHLRRSESGVNVPADMLHYGVTKAAMLALANGLAKLTRGTDGHGEHDPRRPDVLGRAWRSTVERSRRRRAGADDLKGVDRRPATGRRCCSGSSSRTRSPNLARLPGEPAVVRDERRGAARRRRRADRDPLKGHPVSKAASRAVAPGRTSGMTFSPNSIASASRSSPRSPKISKPRST